MSIVVTGELGVDLDLVRRSGFRIVRHGGPELVREFFRFFDDDSTSEATYLVLSGDVEPEHLLDPARLNRALSYLVGRAGGRLFIPRSAWKKLDHQKVSICDHDLGVSILADPFQLTLPRGTLKSREALPLPKCQNPVTKLPRLLGPNPLKIGDKNCNREERAEE